MCPLAMPLNPSFVLVQGARGRKDASHTAPSHVSTRILEGDADESQVLFPYVALVQSNMSCTGSLIAPRLVLTAAHCLREGSVQAFPDEVKIRIKEAWYNVDSVFVHDKYTDISTPNEDTSIPEEFNFSYDIAMVVLSTAAGEPPVSIAAFPTPINAKVFAAGFGVDDSGQGSPDLLRYTALDVMPAWACEDTQDDQFCAGGTEGYTCQGDSGGPVVLMDESGSNHIIVGITSWGEPGCKTPYTFQTNVPSHIATIRKWVAASTTSEADKAITFITAQPTSTAAPTTEPTTVPGEPEQPDDTIYEPQDSEQPGATTYEPEDPDQPEDTTYEPEDTEQPGDTTYEPEQPDGDVYEPEDPEQPDNTTYEPEDPEQPNNTTYGPEDPEQPDDTYEPEPEDYEPSDDVTTSYTGPQDDAVPEYR
jgi:hypothetical protein